jgi:hypothetical protein
MDPATLAALIQGGSSLLSSFGNRNPYRAGGKQLGQIQGFGREAYNPFIQQGQQAQNQLSPQYQQMAQNPQSIYDQAFQGYKPSAGYQHKQKLLNEAAHNTAASGGYLGTEGDIARRSEGINGLLGTDMEEYLKHIFGIQGRGIAGLQGQADQGYNAASSLADYLGTAGGRQANYNIGQQDYSNQMQTSGLSMLADLIGKNKLKIPGNRAPYRPLTSGVADYTKAQSPMAGNSGLFGNYGGY